MCYLIEQKYGLKRTNSTQTLSYFQLQFTQIQRALLGEKAGSTGTLLFPNSNNYFESKRHCCFDCFEFCTVEVFCVHNSKCRPQQNENGLLQKRKNESDLQIQMQIP